MATNLISKFNPSAGRNPGGTAGGIGGVIFAVVWISFSCMFVSIGGGSFWKSLVQSTWQRVPCVVDEFQILDDPKQNEPFSTKVTFHYEAGGRERSGHHLYPARVPAAKSGRKAEAEDAGNPAANDGRESDYEKLANLQHQYLGAPAAVCLVDRNDPDHAALMVKRGDFWGSLAFTGFGLCFVGIGVGLLLQSIRQIRGGVAAAAALTGQQRQSSQLSPLIGVPFFGLFAAAGCGMFCVISVPIVRNLVASSSWVETPATVVWSQLRTHSGDKGSTYSPDIFYRYTFSGKAYRSNRSNLLDVSSGGRSGKEEVVRANPPGKAITCYVNPRQPWEVVRNRALGWSVLFGLFPLPFMGIGLGGLWFVLRRKSPAGSSALTRDASRSSSGTTPPGRSDGFGATAAAGGARECQQLTPGKGRILRFLGTLFVAAFWNGIVSVFLWHLADEWQSRHTPWFLTLFMIPFVVIGIGLLLAALHALGAIFNPRPLVSLEPAQPRLGQPLTVTWQIPSGAARLANLRIVLRGEEVATYRRGTNTATDRAIFHEAVIFDSTLPQMIERGRAAITLPANLVPSWKANNNRIEWTLRVEGGIRPWPDLADAHILTITSAR
ncbi:MAG: DUF3592 domain-containing protein [Verrucomicrobiota bacterium]